MSTVSRRGLSECCTVGRGFRSVSIRFKWIERHLMPGWSNDQFDERLPSFAYLWKNAHPVSNQNVQGKQGTICFLQKIHNWILKIPPFPLRLLNLPQLIFSSLHGSIRFVPSIWQVLESPDVSERFSYVDLGVSEKVYGPTLFAPLEIRLVCLVSMRLEGDQYLGRWFTVPATPLWIMKQSWPSLDSLVSVRCRSSVFLAVFVYILWFPKRSIRLSFMEMSTCCDVQTQKLWPTKNVNTCSRK